jgi:4'-phosphopantetheinyl transferase
MKPAPHVLEPEPTLGELPRPEGESPHLWLLSASEHRGGIAAAGHLLGPAERERAAGFARPELADRYRAAHLGLRRLLGAYLGQAPERVELTREPCPHCQGAHGRPSVRHGGAPLHYSLSYGGDLVLLAFAERPVGVDIEPVPEADVVDDVVSTLHPDEQAELRALAPPARAVAFARLWARKEAYLKGTGEGLGGDDLAKAYLGSGPRPVEPPGWALTDCAVPNGHAACVALARR